ncbi:hypothetical protein ABTF07_20070, partial [Acinetobacter baumannii]
EAEMQSEANVIDLEYVFKTLQAINQDFSKLPPSMQRDLIEDILHRVTVIGNKIHAEYYGQADSDIFDLDELETTPKKGQKKSLEA